MRKIYCPICAGTMKETLSGLECSVPGGTIQHPTARTIRRAVYAVDAPRRSPRSPEFSPYLWCPNCTGEMDTFDERGKELRCPECGLSFPSAVQLELMAVRGEHMTLEQAAELGYRPSDH